MKSLIFFGSDRYSEAVLDRLVTHGKHSVSAVITTRSIPKKDNDISEPNIVEKYAVKRDIKVLHYPIDKNEMDTFISQLRSTRSADNAAGLTASFPRLLPPALLEIFGSDIYNIHPSLLPQYRNVAPVPYAIAMGDTETGVSIFHISNGIDNGMIAAQTSETVHPEDTTPVLLDRLFSAGVNLFEKYLSKPDDPSLTASIPHIPAKELIFTRKLTRDSAYIEWPAVRKLLSGGTVSGTETANPLIRLRLNHHPDRTRSILSDMIRAFTGYEKIWSVVEGGKGKLQISLTLRTDGSPGILIAGKPKPITLSDFEKYYI